MVFDHFIEAKPEVYVFRVKDHALKYVGTKAVQWARMVETQRGNENTIKSLTDLDR